MDPQWILVIIAWGIIIGVVIASFILDAKMTPEQRKADAERLRAIWKKNRVEEKRKRQQARENAPAKGCLQSTIEFGFMCAFLMVVVIICIMLIVASGN